MTRETLTVEQVEALRRALTPAARLIVDLHDVDYSRGRTVTQSGATHCSHIWTRKGHRITVSIGQHGQILSQGKDPDPELPEPLEEVKP